MAIEILAHRANLNGPERDLENSLQACRRALQKGFGLEIDLRRDSANRFYISHDPAPLTSENALDSFLPLFREHPHLPIAVNVKELGYEAALIDLQKRGAFGGNDFYFDFELLEPKTPGRTQRLIASLPGGDTIRLASRLSDRGESLAQCLSIPAAIVWADEFDSLWLNESDIHSLHNAGRHVYAISPELHGFPHDKQLARWAEFRAWKIDGLCTDYALEARDFFGE
jgi:glycerophosphoryl diester phosphodiesterase